MISWTIAKLKAKSIHERHLVWLRAKAIMETNDEAKALVHLIETSGLDYAKDKVKGISLDDPIGRSMKRVIGSEEGRQAMLHATEQGLPALAGAEPLLRAELGENYNNHNEATIQAGYLVTGVMEGAGYEKVRQVPMPAGSIAKTALMFKHRKLL